jgi:TonB family protein
MTRLLFFIIFSYCFSTLHFAQNCSIDIYDDRSVISFSSEMPEGSLIEFFVYEKKSKKWEKIEGLSGDIGVIRNVHKTYVAIWNHTEYPNFHEIDGAKIRITDQKGSEEELLCKKANKRTSENPDKVFDYTEQKAEYPGGQEAMYNELRSYIVYPEMEKQNQIEGTVYVSFIVEATGYVTNIQILRGVDEGPGFNKAAIAAVSKLKYPFYPAKTNNVPVRLKMTIPVKFSLTDESLFKKNKK